MRGKTGSTKGELMSCDRKKGPIQKAYEKWEIELDQELPGDSSIPITDILAKWTNLYLRKKPIPQPKTKNEKRAVPGWLLLVDGWKEMDVKFWLYSK